jgi:flagellar hook-associated protein 3 FlgL
MRLSTAQIFDSGTNGLLRNQYDLYRIQNQMSTGRKVVTPADDPVAAAQALATEQKLHVNAQFLDNQGNADAQLRELESLMASVGELLINAKARWVEAGNGAYGNKELKELAVDIRAKFEQLLGIANNTDAHGQYRFAGYQSGTQPFVGVGGNTVYQGDEGERQIQVEASRFMTVNYSGRQFFEAVLEGNGTFVANANTANTGSGVISNGSLIGSFSGHDYQLNFTSPTQYTIDDTDPVTGVTTTTGPFTYTEDEAIDLGGAQVSISGAPVAGDAFTVTPSKEKSLFATLNDFIVTLENGNPESAEFRNAMLRVGAGLDQGLQHVVDNRAVIGMRMSELEALTFLDSDLDVQYQEQISSLVDLDYNKAISDLSKNQLQLQAAMQSFLKVSGLSLFNYI